MVPNTFVSLMGLFYVQLSFFEWRHESKGWHYSF